MGLELLTERHSQEKVAHNYRYYLTLFGKHVIATGLKLKQLVLIPQLAAFPSR